MAEAELEARLQRLRDEIDGDVALYLKLARRNYGAVYAIVLIGIGSSIAAGLLAFLKADSQLVGILALIPAAATIILKQLNFQAKANWHYAKTDALKALRLKTDYGLPADYQADDIAAIAAEYGKTNSDFSKRWEESAAFSTDILPFPKDNAGSRASEQRDASSGAPGQTTGQL